jgi:hypothetical protein
MHRSVQSRERQQADGGQHITVIHFLLPDGRGCAEEPVQTGSKYVSELLEVPRLRLLYRRANSAP